MDKQAKTRRRSLLGWALSFAGGHKGSYVGSVLLALLSVDCGFVSYIFMPKIMKGLLEKTTDFQYCMTQCLWMALFFVLDRLFHAFSTTLSQQATFEVLANIRRRLTRKLSRMPLGDMLDESSGTYKNIIVERVDSIETTLAHMIPEVTSNFIIPFVIFGYMVSIKWQLVLLSPITVPVGLFFFALMMRGSQASYQNTVVKTKALNDTAVDYINGIEVMPIQSYVTDEELNAVLSQIDVNAPMGKRDLAMILLAATTGMRACDIIRLKLSDIDWRKEKCKNVPDNVHPHLWRHSRAMHLYQHGMDLTLVSQWLGHSQLETTLIYAHADTEHKRKAIDIAMGGSGEDSAKPVVYTVSDEEILKKLYGLK